MHCCHKTEAGSPAAATLSTPIISATSAIPRLPVEPIASAMLIGVVVDAEDSGMLGEENQILVEFNTSNENKKCVLAELSRGLSVVPGDRILFVMPANSSLAVITSVLSPAPHGNSCETTLVVAGTRHRLPASQELILRDSESLCVTTSTGQTLVAIERGACGPIIRLGEGSLELDMPGELHLMADSLRFTTRSGPISIQSQTDDVVVQGRTIRLN
jgi:hypothetical protein